MSSAVEALELVSGQLSAMADALGRVRTKFVDPATVQPFARKVATVYFESVRAELDVCKSRVGLVEEIDFTVQNILGLTSSRREKVAYLGHIAELRPCLLEATIDLLKSRGLRLVLSETEQGILRTLNALLPAAGASYEQALFDIAQGGRSSWRGTATELREALREVIDHLAPDNQVASAQNFQYEPNQTRPTQRQKVRFILRARRSPSAATTVAESSLDRVEEATAALARTTYQRGSVSTHVGATGIEIKNLKRYVDAMLAELLEVS
jgi:hypothetical protein